MCGFFPDLVILPIPAIVYDIMGKIGLRHTQINVHASRHYRASYRCKRKQS